MDQKPLLADHGVTWLVPRVPRMFTCWGHCGMSHPSAPCCGGAWVPVAFWGSFVAELNAHPWAGWCEALAF